MFICLLGPFQPKSFPAQTQSSTSAFFGAFSRDESFTTAELHPQLLQHKSISSISPFYIWPLFGARCSILPSTGPCTATRGGMSPFSWRQKYTYTYTWCRCPALERTCRGVQSSWTLPVVHLICLFFVTVGNGRCGVHAFRWRWWCSLASNACGDVQDQRNCHGGRPHIPPTTAAAIRDLEAADFTRPRTSSEWP
jgi:hypothetical protein